MKHMTVKEALMTGAALVVGVLVSLYIVAVVIHPNVTSILIALLVSKVSGWVVQHGYLAIGFGPKNGMISLAEDDRTASSHVRCIVISDTMNQHRKLTIPDGDVLIHSGDMTVNGTMDELKDFGDWISKLPHKHKIVIAGNQDDILDAKTAVGGKKAVETAENFLKSCCTYIKQKTVVVSGINFYGAPHIPDMTSHAFGTTRGLPIAEVWAQIPKDTDVLITHTPPWGIRDLTVMGKNVGCENLRRMCDDIVKPRYHIFGHVHETYGVAVSPETIYINGATCNLLRRPTHPPIICDIPTPKSGEVSSKVSTKGPLQKKNE